MDNNKENKSTLNAVLDWCKARPVWQWVVLAVVLLAAIIAYAAWRLYVPISGVFDTGDAGELAPIEQDPDLEANGERFYNLLVIGLDYDPTDVDGEHNYEDGKANTDVIMYAQIDRDEKKIRIFQIPRDSYVGETFSDGSKIPFGRINGVYSHGPDQENYINNLAQTVYDMFKLPVDNYVAIDMIAFKTLLNAMGGITMYVPWDIVADNGDILIPQGRHPVNGDQAEVILRNRNYASADYQRLETQQYFYAAMVDTLLNNYGLRDYYDVCKILSIYINTDLSLSEMYGIYATVTKMDPSDIFVIRAPGGPVDFNGHTWLYGVNRDRCAEVLNKYFRDPDMPVDAEHLNLKSDWVYTMGETYDEGKTLGSVDGGGGAKPVLGVE